MFAPKKTIFDINAAIILDVENMSQDWWTRRKPEVWQDLAEVTECQLPVSKRQEWPGTLQLRLSGQKESLSAVGWEMVTGQAHTGRQWQAERKIEQIVINFIDPAPAG